MKDLGIFGDSLWRERVRRLAQELQRSEEDPLCEERFDDRRCDVCGIAMMANSNIYLPTEPFACDHCLGEPNDERQYWFACCLEGVDPEGRHGANMSRRRQKELSRICAENGLMFGQFAKEPA